MPNKITLTRKEIESIVTFLALNRNVVRVDIAQSSYGIGFTHIATFIKNDGSTADQDITDVDAW